MTVSLLSFNVAAQCLRALQKKRPLVHCLTNEVVQELTANVLSCAGASPAMVVDETEAREFAAIADALLINLGTPTPQRVKAMLAAIHSANEHHRPWVLDPVAAGVIPSRDKLIGELIALKPTAIRANASEILAIAGQGQGGQGVDSLNTSDDALPSAQRLARELHTIVCVTGETDYITDGERVLATQGGHPIAQVFVGTGCSLSALVAAFLGTTPTLEAVATACLMAKMAARYAVLQMSGMGSFVNYYLEGLYTIKPDSLIVSGSCDATN